MTKIGQSLKSSIQRYGINFPTDGRTKAFKEILKNKKWIVEEYNEFLKDLVKEARKRENQKIKQFSKQRDVKAEVIKAKETKVNRGKSASKIQLKYLRNKLFYMKPSDSAWNSYNKYTIYNDRPQLYDKEEYVSLTSQVKAFLEFYNVKQFISKFKGYKIWLGVTCDGPIIFSSKSRLILWNNKSDADNILDTLYTSISIYENQPYAQLPNIKKLDIHIAKVNALTGSSYIPLPDFIKNKKAIINIKNDDNKCFLYSVLCGLKCPEKNEERVTKYLNRLDELKYKDEDMPMDLNKIMFFEKRNNVRINVYGLIKTDVVPLYVSAIKERGELPFIHLFYHKGQNENGEIVGHYSYIKNFNRLFGCNGKHHQICPYCCQFTVNSANAQAAKASLENHMKYCIAGQKVQIPEKIDNISFTHYSHINKCPIRIYADFETFNDTSLQHKSKNGNTDFKTGHKPASFKLMVVSDFDIEGFQKVNDNFIYEYMYKGSDSDVHFIKKISQLETDLLDKMKEQREKHYDYKFMIITDENKLEHKDSTKCWVCKCNYSKENRKVRHHNHDTGLYHSTMCQRCNVQIKDKWHIPVMFHNLNYDKNVFFKSIVHMKDQIKNVSILADNSQSYKAFTINNLKFIDTARFMNSSLAKLIENLDDDNMHFLKHLSKDDNKFKYIKQKGYFPYEWFDSIDKLKLPISELKKEYFDNELTLSKLEDGEWDYIQELIAENNIKTFEEFHDFYLHIDVNGLADVFENFRKTSLKYYKLDPCHYVGTPSFAWDAMLLNFNVQLEILKDSEMYLMLERGIRGGQSVIFKKYAKANNKYLDNYDENKPSNYVIYLDANNLYGEAMTHKLPISGFKWVDDVDINTIMNYTEESDIGYILDVYLEYPNELHDLHNDYPLAPEKLKLGQCEKLCGTFNDKTEYVVHISNLKYYLEKGMILKKINRCIKFNQSAWLSGWIEKNTAYRQASQNDFEKDYFKLMNNAVFGKTMENVRGRMDVKCAFDEQYYLKYTTKPNFNKSEKIGVDDDKFFKLVLMDKKVVTLDKPIYAGFSILDLSKLHMYKFHYDTMKPKYGDKIQLLMTDTDSLVYEVQTDDIYKDMYEMKEHFDLSGYSKANPIYDAINNKVIGKFKDETGDNIITEFAALRPKCYSFLTNDNKESKKLKGITKCVVKKNIKFEHYKKCIFGELAEEDKYVLVNSIRTKDFSNYSLIQKKKALENNDDKRVWFGEASLAYGHYKTEQ